MQGAIAEAFVELTSNSDEVGREIQSDLDRAFDGLDRVADEVGRDINRAFDRAGENVEGTFREVSNTAGREFDRVEREAKDAADKSGGSFKGMAAVVGGALAAVGFGSFVKDAVGQAADLGESINAINVVLGEEAGEAFNEFSKSASTNLGITQSALNQALVPAASLLGNAGLEGTALSDSLADLATRATDVGSVMNKDVNEVLEAMGAGIRGETEPLRALGINFNDAAIQAKALEMGLVGAGEEADANAKTQARLALIMEQSEKMAGDFANTADSLPNLLKTIKATGQEASAALGSALIPALQDLLQAAFPIIEAFRPVLTIIGESLGQVVQGLTPIITGLLGALGPLLEGVFGALGPVLQESLTALAPALTDLAVALAPLIVALVEALVPILPMVIDGMVMILEAVTPLIPVITNLVETFAPLAPLLFLVFGPLPGVVVALAALGAVAQELGPQLEPALDALSTVAEIADQVIGILFRGDFQQGGSPFAEDSGFVDTLFDIREALTEVWDIAQQAFKILFQGDFTGGPLAEDSPFVDALFTVREVMGDVYDFVKDNLEPILAGLAAAFLVITAPITAVVAALVLAYTQSETFRNAIQTAIDFITTHVVPAVVAFASSVADSFGDLVGWVKEHWDAIQEAIGHAIETVKVIITVVLNTVEALWRAWGDDLLNMAETIWNYIEETIENGINLVRSIIETVLALINGDWGAAWDGIKGILAAIWDQIHNVVETAINLVESVIGGVLSTIREVWSGIWSGIYDKVHGVWEDIKGVVTGSLDAIVGWVTGLKDRIGEAASDAFGGLLNAVQEVIRRIARAWNKIDLSFTIPDFPGVPGRGQTFDIIPDVPVPEFDSGGFVPGPIGAPRLVLAHGGERIDPLHTLAGRAEVAARDRREGGDTIHQWNVDARGMSATELLDVVNAHAGLVLSNRYDS